MMRAAAILTGPSTHLDHLGVLSTLLNIPLIVTEEKHLKEAKAFYPNLYPELKGLEELSLDFLANHYDVIFQSGKFFAAELQGLLKFFHNKRMRFVFCPHGNSDKGHSLKEHPEQDLYLCYGTHLQDLLIKTEAIKQIKHLIYTGNYRYFYYLSHQAFFDEVAERYVFSQFKTNHPTIFYAPTWQDKENPSSFFSLTQPLIDHLSSSYNLLIKLHPFLIEDHPAAVYPLLARYENHPRVLFLTDFPPIYPLLNRCALYLGDYSSIGYDFLAFNRPLYFLNPKKEKSFSPLHSCGLEVSQENYNNLSSFLISNYLDSQKNFDKQRKEIYWYAFGQERCVKKIKSEIFECLQKN